MFLKIILFIFGCAWSALLQGLFLQLQWVGATLQLWCSGFAFCRARAPGTWAQSSWLPGARVQAQKLWCTGLVAPQRVGSSWATNQTHVSCIGRQILYHWATKEAPIWLILKIRYSSKDKKFGTGDKIQSEMLVAQSCPTLCDPMDCSSSGCSVHGILQARILERVAIPLPRGFSQPRDRTQVSCMAGRFFTIWATRERNPFKNQVWKNNK